MQTVRPRPQSNVLYPIYRCGSIRPLFQTIERGSVDPDRRGKVQDGTFVVPFGKLPPLGLGTTISFGSLAEQQYQNVGHIVNGHRLGLRGRLSTSPDIVGLSEPFGQ